MYRLLIVDDEQIIVEGLREIIEASHLHFKDIRLAYSGKEALTLFKESFFDIVIADIRMPNFDGLQLIHEVKSIYKYCKVIFLSGYSDFEYAQQAISLGASAYLLKPIADSRLLDTLEKVVRELNQEYEQMLSIEKIRSELNKHKHSTKDTTYNEMVKYSIPQSTKNIAEKFEYLHIPFDIQSSVINIVFRIDSWGGGFIDQDRPLLQYCIQNMFNELFGDNYLIDSFQAETMLSVIILQPKGKAGLEDFKRLRARVEEAQDTIYRTLGVITSFAFHDEMIPWCQWSASINSICCSLKFHIGEGLLLSISRRENLNLTPEDCNAVSNLLDIMNKKDINEFEYSLDNIIRDTDQLTDDYELRLVSVFMAVSGYLMNLAGSYNMVISKEQINKLTNLQAHKSLQEMKRFMSDMLQHIIDKIETGKKDPTEALMQQVKDYINNHLNENLSLDELARRTYLNASYLSRVFKEVTQEQISSYITRKKMESARSILLDEGKKIYEVAQMVGYENANYFAKVFRKAYGLSPQEFRVMNNKLKN